MPHITKWRLEFLQSKATVWAMWTGIEPEDQGRNYSPWVQGSLDYIWLLTTVWVTKCDKNMAKMRRVEGRPLMQWDWSPSPVRRGCGTGPGSARGRSGHPAAFPALTEKNEEMQLGFSQGWEAATQAENMSNSGWTWGEAFSPQGQPSNRAGAQGG